MFLLSKGQLVAGNTKAWLGTSSVKELSFSGHTHSNYALTSHTHTEYAAANHTHNQYVTEVDINQMIEDVIDSYIPTIQTMGQVGFFDSNQKHITIILSSTAKFFMIFDISNSYSPAHFIRLSNDWSLDSDILDNDLTITLSGDTITLDYSGLRKHFYYLWL